MREETMARELALLLLFQYEFNDGKADEVALLYAEHNAYTEAVKSGGVKLFEGIVAKIDDVDNMISQASRNWTLKRISKLDRNILRLSVFEMFFLVPPLKPSIAIDEAVNLAKQYGATESGSFVNGILDQIRRNQPTD